MIKYFSGWQRVIWFAAFCLTLPAAFPAVTTCPICGNEIKDFVVTVTDQVTGTQLMVCSNCFVTLPRCFLCGVPVKTNSTILPDGRYLCDRDAKSVVLDVGEVKRMATQINADLNRTFSRFTAFPENVEVEVIDRIDEYKIFHQTGFDFESPSLLGCIQAVKDTPQQHHYWMRVMTGQTLAGLKATIAHELGHAWAGDNIFQERRNRIGHDTEEGFCEMVAYLLMDAQHEEGQKKFILRNHYTRGQVFLFIEAEQRYGLEDVLDWMRFGNTGALEAGHLDKIRDVTMPLTPPLVPKPHVAKINSSSVNTNSASAKPSPAHDEFKLDGIMWDTPPLAIINGHTFAPNEEAKVKLGASNVLIRCVAITKNSVRIWEVDSGQEHELYPQ